MVLLSGPRQVGKTTLAKSLLQSGSDHYMNWDFPADREAIINNAWPTDSGLLVLDEIHKYSEWRNVVKGLKDVELRYYRDKYGREIDFILVDEDGTPIKAIECKSGQKKPSTTLSYFKSKFPDTEVLQICVSQKEKKIVYGNGVISINAVEFLSDLI